MENIFTTYRNRPMLADVVVMRLGLIFLLIATHSFAPYSGSWDILPNMATGSLYKYISPCAHFISMPALIFISGYLFGHTWHRTKNQPFREFIFKKAKRLIIPSIVFSGFYYFLFYNTNTSFSHIGYNILNGCGHLWFLPMLFWCFIFTFLIHKFSLSPKFAFPILIAISILPIPTLPLRLGSTCTYLIYFYLGSNLQIEGGGIHKYNTLTLLSLMILYLILQYIYPQISLPTNYSTVYKILYLLLLNGMKLLMSLSGIGIAYTATRMFLHKVREIPVYIIALSTYCYGVYIFHQFILKYFYYCTPAPECLYPEILPWVAFIVTLFLSVSITAIFLKNKIGKYLIG